MVDTNTCVVVVCGCIMLFLFVMHDGGHSACLPYIKYSRCRGECRLGGDSGAGNHVSECEISTIIS